MPGRPVTRLELRRGTRRWSRYLRKRRRVRTACAGSPSSAASAASAVVAGRQRAVTAADDALPAIGAISTWISHADAKIGILGIVDTALAGAFVSQSRRVRMTVDHPGGRDIVALALLGLGVVALVISVLSLYRALRPRLDSRCPTRFAFPWVADADLADLMAAGHEQIRREAWIQAQALSVIARAKYLDLRRAIPCAAWAGMLLASWIVISSI